MLQNYFLQRICSVCKHGQNVVVTGGCMHVSSACGFTKKTQITRKTCVYNYTSNNAIDRISLFILKSQTRQSYIADFTPGAQLTISNSDLYR